MSKEGLETRLRAAYQARAALVDDDRPTSLDLSADHGVRRWHRHPYTRLVGPLAAALAVGALALSASLIHDGGSSPAGRSTRSPQQKTISPDALAFRATSSLPTGMLTDGLSLVVLAPGSSVGTADVLAVSMAGGRVMLAQIPDNHPEILDWAVDGTRVLLSYGTASVHIVTLDLVNGHSVEFRTSEAAARFADPHGQTISLGASSGQIVDDAGAPIVGGGQPPGTLQLLVNGHVASVLKRGSTYEVVSGSQTMRLRMPTARRGCTPMASWTDNSVLFRCADQQYWAIPLSGAAPGLVFDDTAALRHGAAAAAHLWKVGSDEFLERLTSCGVERPLYRVAVNRSDATEVKIPVGPYAVVGATNSGFYILVGFNGGCEANATALDFWAPQTGALKPLIGAAGSARSAILSASTFGLPVR